MALTSPTTENQALLGMASGSPSRLAYVSLASGSPGTTGAAEFGGITRQSVTWGAPSNGVMTNTNALTFTTAGTVAATYFATFDATSGTNYGTGGALSSSITAATIVIPIGALSVAAS